MLSCVYGIYSVIAVKTRKNTKRVTRAQSRLYRHRLLTTYQTSIASIEYLRFVYPRI